MAEKKATKYYGFVNGPESDITDCDLVSIYEAKDENDLLEKIKEFYNDTDGDEDCEYFCFEIKPLYTVKSTISFIKKSRVAAK